MICPNLEMIWAQSVDRQPIIGINGRLPWHLPEDLKHFQTMTINQVVIMGRKTWQSLPSRPLSRRLNIVLTSSSNRAAYSGAIVSSNLSTVINSYCGVSRKLIVIGGYELFLAAMPLASRLYVTEVDRSVYNPKAQLVYAPVIERQHWKVDSYHGWKQSPSTGTRYRILRYSRF